MMVSVIFVPPKSHSFKGITMSASPWMVQPDIDHISRIVKDFGAEVVQETNKRIIMWCPTLYCAKLIALHI